MNKTAADFPTPPFWVRQKSPSATIWQIESVWEDHVKTTPYGGGFTKTFTFDSVEVCDEKGNLLTSSELDIVALTKRVESLEGKIAQYFIKVVTDKSMHEETEALRNECNTLSKMLKEADSKNDVIRKDLFNINIDFLALRVENDKYRSALQRYAGTEMQQIALEALKND